MGVVQLVETSQSESQGSHECFMSGMLVSFMERYNCSNTLKPLKPSLMFEANLGCKANYIAFNVCIRECINIFNIYISVYH